MSSQGIFQKKSALTLPCLVIVFQVLILIWKCQKWSLNRGTLLSATAIYQTKCPFTVLSAPFLFFRTLPDDSRLFPASIVSDFDQILLKCPYLKETNVSKIFSPNGSWDIGFWNLGNFRAFFQKSAILIFLYLMKLF